MSYKRCEWSYCNHKVRWRLSCRTSSNRTREIEFCTGHAADAMAYPECEWTRFERIKEEPNE